MKHKIVEITMKEETLSKVEKVKDRVHAASESDVVRLAVDLMDTVTSSIKNGKKVIIEEGWGKKRELRLDSLNT